MITKVMIQNNHLFLKFLVYLHRKYSSNVYKFVPKHPPLEKCDIKRLEDFIVNSSKLLVLTGAGISTESGIPDYRSEEVGLYARSNHKPMTYQEFLTSAYGRKRYWARSYIGWDRFSYCQPNATHISLRNLELDHYKIDVIITQNVDRLHTKAGSINVVELHGTLYEVICLSCHKKYCRFKIQEQMKKLNPNIREFATMVRPDGDVDISEDQIKQFLAPQCEECGGILKPDVVYFGDNVPRERVMKVTQAVTNSDSLLVLGSSLSVYSSYRIVLQAAEEKKNIAIVNIGPTRADHCAHLRISAKCGEILPKIC
ncbi:NAD-dependent protein deacylase Sirt4 isoform X2 [Agrilus planipennis]|uniref:NAD-dependent protein deacylase n=1 Tax=Agrilus planipennis TaxID=224129 RepID=A0A1W4XD59_AGRPL|nr:NAD-dependent protein deacylase Sirt4 isoform X2 [Agrilus planipennis]